TKELNNLLLSLSNQIREYSHDYYKWKTPPEIASKINIDIGVVLRHLNSINSRILLEEISNGVTRLYTARKIIDNTITETSEIKHVSSYRILKEIQLLILWEAINKSCP